jgi:hypothetical protein
MNRCERCGHDLAAGEMTCGSCGSLLPGNPRVAEVPLEEEAALIYDLLTSAGFHPVLAWLDEGGRPLAVDREGGTVPAAGLLPPLTTPFAVYVPEDEAVEAAQVLQDAGRSVVSDEPPAS